MPNGGHFVIDRDVIVKGAWLHLQAGKELQSAPSDMRLASYAESDRVKRLVKLLIRRGSVIG